MKFLQNVMLLKRATVSLPLQRQKAQHSPCLSSLFVVFSHLQLFLVLERVRFNVCVFSVVSALCIVF